MSETSMEVRRAEMSDEMQRDALQVALLAMNMFTDGYGIANYIRKEFDRKHGKYWHCIVGNCGYSVTHNTDSYINFSVAGNRIVLFKTD